MNPTVKKLLLLAAVFLGAWLGFRYVLPLALPFLMGIALALTAEKSVAFLTHKTHIRRSIAAAIGVSATLVLLLGILALGLGLAVRQMTRLVSALPDLEQTASDGLGTLQNVLLRLSDGAPDGVRPLLQNTVNGMFQDGSAIVDQLSSRIPAVASAVLGRVPGGALAVGTGVLSAYMISARLPELRRRLGDSAPAAWVRQYTPALTKLRRALGGWLKAQGKLAALSFAIVLAGLLIMGIPNAPVWALVTALVDAVPVLGTGTVLLPWALVLLVKGEAMQAIIMLCTYAAAFLARSALEPRLVGKQLGIDPLMTLVALYAGYRIWGFAGVVVSPLLCVAATELFCSQ